MLPSNVQTVHPSCGGVIYIYEKKVKISKTFRFEYYDFLVAYIWWF